MPYGYGSKLKPQDEDRGFESLIPFPRVPFRAGYLFLTHGQIVLGK